MKKATKTGEDDPGRMQPDAKSNLTAQSGKERSRMGPDSRGRDAASRSGSSKAMSRISTVGDETDGGAPSRQTSDASNYSGQV